MICSVCWQNFFGVCFCHKKRKLKQHLLFQPTIWDGMKDRKHQCLWSLNNRCMNLELVKMLVYNLLGEVAASLLVDIVCKLNHRTLLQSWNLFMTRLTFSFSDLHCMIGVKHSYCVIWWLLNFHVNLWGGYNLCPMRIQRWPKCSGKPKPQMYCTLWTAVSFF